MELPEIFRSRFDDIDFFDNDFEKNISKELYGKSARNLMKTDIKEADNEYVILIDLPGFSKESIHLSLAQGYLIVKAEKGLQKEDENKNKFIHQERYEGCVQRSYFVGIHVREEDIIAKYENGILEVHVPKEDDKEHPTSEIKIQ